MKFSSPIIRRCFASAAAFAVCAGGAWAQDTDPATVLPSNDVIPSPRVPFPKNGQNIQNQNRASADVYFGVTNGNFPWNLTVDARFGNLNTAAGTRQRMFKDGWVFPRSASAPPPATGDPGSPFVQRPPIQINETAGTPVGAWAAPTPGPDDLPGENGPYLRAVATSRNNTAASTFTYTTPPIPGPAGGQTRYAIYVYVPPVQADETRVPDARYRVNYSGGRSKTYFVSQLGPGYVPLQEPDGSIPFFPFAVGATGTIVLDNTTGQPGQNTTFVVADDIVLVQQFNVARSTPTLTNRHGGRLLVGGAQPAVPAASAAEFAPDSTLFQGPTIFATGPATVGDPAVAEPFLFSQMQVLVGVTEHVPDPDPRRNRDGTRSIEVGAVYALDWLTGTPLWRFPDATHLPGGSRAAPGIGSIDKNGNGAIERDEIYIVGQDISLDTENERTSLGGGISGSVTFAPNINAVGTLQALVGGVLTPVAVNGPQPMAFVGSNNGVLYALNAYGNNDTQYAAPAVAGQPITDANFTPGTTNLYWTFHVPFLPRNTGETLVQYHQRLKASVPATRGFGASSAVIAFNRPPGEDPNLPPSAALDPTEPRLFIGNENGILYALDARAASPTGILPYRKGGVDTATQLKWWFEAQGAIQSTPAVSRRRLDAGGPPRLPAITNLVERGVYFTTVEGRVYCVDWTGPVDKGADATPVNYDGTPASAEALNNNFRFHNTQSAEPNAAPDETSGSIRPRWTFPNRYTDVEGGDNRDDAPDTVAGNRLGAPTVLAPIFSGVSLMEFATDPTGTAFRSYVVLAANDPSPTGVATTGKVYLLDAAGNRQAILTNPQQVQNRTVAHPMDRWAPREAMGNATPAWTHRFQYGVAPNINNFLGPVAGPAGLEPARRDRPTVYVGGIGRLYAIDIDPTSNLFARWPADPGNLPDDTTALDPPPPGATGEPVQARAIPVAIDGSRVESLTITGGPLQVRGLAPGTTAPGQVPFPTDNPFGLNAVNQDIRDPLTLGGLLPAYSAANTYQYPAIFVSTAAGNIFEISSNTEGLDTVTPPAPAENSVLGWALTNDTQRFNPEHTLLDGQQGPGGTSGVAVLSNVEFDGLQGAPADPATYLTGPPPPFQPRPNRAGDTHTGQTGFPLDSRGLYDDPRNDATLVSPEGTVDLPYRPVGATGTAVTDVNLLANRAAWIFAGGPDGTIYAFTPSEPTAVGGFGTYPGGNVLEPNPDERTTGDPVADLFTQAEYERLLASARMPRNPGEPGTAERPNRDNTLTRNPGDPVVYEWGDTIHIVAWDLNAATATDPLPTPGTITYYNRGGRSVTITLENLRTGVRTTLPPVEVQPNTYTIPGGTIPLGLAFMEYRLTQPSPTQPQTPGSYFRVSVTQTTVRQLTPTTGAPVRTTPRIGRPPGGANSQAIAENFKPVFAIANPLAVQAFLTDTRGNVANPAGGSTDTVNGIGPFLSGGVGPGGSTARSRLSTAPGVTPDKQNAEYDQAVTNGNSMLRIDLRNYVGTQVNPLVGKPIPGETDTYYLPVAAGGSYMPHGAIGSTGNNLRLMNRSNLAALAKIRVTTGDLLWRHWPGAIPNADADAAGVAGGNVRITPNGMSPTGAINPLPWDVLPGENKPWLTAARDLNPNAVATGSINVSRNYPDISRTGIQVRGPAGDLTSGTGSLTKYPAALAALDGSSNSGARTNPESDLATPLRALVSVKIPPFQPANLVATGSLTSTYVLPNAADGAATGGVTSPVQLPRGLAARQIQTTAGAGNTVVPFGYTTRMIVFVDVNDNGRLDLPTNSQRASTGVDFNSLNIQGATQIEEPFREFEVWTGVPVDMRIKTQESVIDAGLLPHGFAQQNGLLGYNTDATNPLGVGFVPFPLSGAYQPFFKSFTVVNEGNVNLYNLRAAQLFTTTPDASLDTASNLTMPASIVDRRYGISAQTADPNRAVMPNVVTSLDTRFDPAWLAAEVASYPAPYGGAGGHYERLGGRHTLHKAAVGSTSGSLLSLPDSAENASPNETVNAGGIYVPRVGVSVPIGTPVGNYAITLPIFEDHDTVHPNGDLSTVFGNGGRYAPVPVLANGAIIPAGPLYGGRNDAHYRDANRPGGATTILPAGSESIFRPRQLIATPPRFEYLPSTNPSFVLKATVGESALTGQVPDSLIVAQAGIDPASNVVNGLLPYVDPFPLIDQRSQPARAASALTPGAFRSVTSGNLSVYFSRNADPANPNTAAATPGQPFNLFHSRLNWDNTTGAWKATAFGAPTASPNANNGRWFTEPVAVGNGAAANSSNTSPYVLHEVQVSPDTGQANAETATLFWLNTQQTQGGPFNTILYAPLDTSTGVPGDVQSFLTNVDPALRRYGPRAVAVSSSAGTTKDTLFVLYYGGVTGRLALYYSAADFDAAGGVPTGNAADRRERQLNVPTALSSASDPSPVYRLVPNLYPSDAQDGGDQVPVVDLYYTGISRANQNTDIYMTRYRVSGARVQARLDPLPLPRITREQLVAPGRDPVWHARHLSWSRQLNDDPRTTTGPVPDERARLPVIYVNDLNTPVAPAVRANGTAAWGYDNATGLLFQSIGTGPNLTLVYVDPSAGTVRFRGALTPRGSDRVYADYTPQTYRVTQDATSDASPVAFMDRSPQFATTDANTSNSVLRRPSPPNATDRASFVDRQWVVWQKGAQSGRASTLYYSARRVGVDLKTILPANGGLEKNGSVALGELNTATGNQPLRPTFTFTVNGRQVPFDVDFARGRVFVGAENEGFPFTITYQAFVPGGPIVQRTATGTLAFIDEMVSEQMVPMQRSVNEGQPWAFVDQTSYVNLVPAAQQQARAGDPTLAQGRVWMFWTSPRSRSGLFNLPSGPAPGGYDIFWQTIAPRFESPSSYTGVVPP